MTTNLSGSPQKSKSTEQNNALSSSSVLRPEEAAASIPVSADAYPSLSYLFLSPGQPEVLNDVVRRSANVAASLNILLAEIRPENRDARAELAGAYLDLCEFGQKLESLGASSVEPLPYTRRESFGEAMNNLVFCFKSDYPNLNMALHFPKANTALENLIEESEAYEDMLKYFQVATSEEEMKTELYHKNKMLNKKLRMKLILLRSLRSQRRIEELTKITEDQKRARNEEE